MLGLDLIGAGEGLATQTIMLRVRTIDVAKLKAKLAEPPKPGGGQTAGAVIGPALDVADRFPKAAVDMVLPYAKRALDDYGVTADLTVTEQPPAARATGEAGWLLAIGAVLGAGLAAGAGWAYRRLRHRKERR